MAKKTSAKPVSDNVEDPAFAWAAYLAASWWEGDMAPPTAQGEPASVVSVLRVHRFPILSLAADSRPDGARLMATRSFRTALSEDMKRLEHQISQFKEVGERWKEAGIPSLFLKALGPSPCFPYTSDNLDVLVPPDRLDEARGGLRDLGYLELRHLEEPHKFLFRRHQTGEPFFDLHLHGRIEWHVSFLDDDAVWTHSRPSSEGGAIRIPSLEDGVLVTLAHAVFENKSWRLADLAKILFAVHASPLDWERMQQTARSKGWLSGFVFGLELCGLLEKRIYGTTSLQEKMLADGSQAMSWRQKAKADRLSAGRTELPVQIPFLYSKSLFFRKIWKDKTNPLASRAKDAITHSLRGTRLRLGFRSQRPMLIALDGVDGSGKTTQARLLADALRAAAIRHRIVWTRGGSSPLLQPAIRIGRKILGVKKPPATASVELREDERADRFRNPFIRVLWLWLVSVETALSYWAHIGWPLLRGNVVIADRYILGTLLDLSARFERTDLCQTLPISLLRRVSPKPRFQFWLDVPWEEASARRGRWESASFIKKQAELASQMGACFDAARLDGKEPPGIIGDRMIVHVMRSYLDVHRTWLNGLFCSNPSPLPKRWRGAR